jgi:xanthine dehydrogenase molybdenum-binding subunit
VASNIVLSEIEYKVVGKRFIRPDGVDKVTGRAQYGADIQLTGLLHAKILRSPHAHARIRSIDASQAEAYPGVHAVVTAKDLPFASLTNEQLGGDFLKLKFLSDHILASDKALFKGHPVGRRWPPLIPTWLRKPSS